MLVELLGGPFDGDQAKLHDSVHSIVLMRPDFATFLQPAGEAPGDLPPGFERTGEYVADGSSNTPTTFTWYGDE